MPITSLAMAVCRAIDHDLPDVNHTSKTGTIKAYRPSTRNIEVYHFPQTWGDTSIGFGGVGGQSLTMAYTTVIILESQHACVYFNGKLAYHVESVGREFLSDLSNHNMAAVSGRGKYANK
jgi:hypothetical protein